MNESELKRLLERLDAEAGRADAFDGDRAPAETPISPAEEAGWRRLGAAMGELRNANNTIHAPKSIASSVRARLGFAAPASDPVLDHGVVAMRREQPAGPWRHAAAAAAMLAIISVAFVIAGNHLGTRPNTSVADRADLEEAKAASGYRAMNPDDESRTSATLAANASEHARKIAEHNKLGAEAPVDSPAPVAPVIAFMAIDTLGDGLEELSKNADAQGQRARRGAASALRAHELEIHGDAATLSSRREQVARIVDEIRFGKQLDNAAPPERSFVADDPTTADGGEWGPGASETESETENAELAEGDVDAGPGAGGNTAVIADYVATMTKREYDELLRRIEHSPELRKILSVSRPAQDPVAEPAAPRSDNEGGEGEKVTRDDLKRGTDKDKTDLPPSEERVQVRIRFVQSK
jgi:hypothetical protein